MKMRFLFKFAVAGSMLLLGAMLLATIYFTLFDLQWIAFLTGVLFAGVLAMASQTARVQWLIVRRTRQFERAKELLAKETARRERAENGLEAMEARFQSIADALSTMIVFVGRDEVCRYHNLAFRRWCERGADRINSLPLRTVVGDAVYEGIAPHIADALAGRDVRYDALCPRPDGATVNLNITLLSYPPGVEKPSGFYALITSAARVAAATKTQVDDAVHDATKMAQENGEPVYVGSMAEQLISGSDPRAQLLLAIEHDQFVLFAQKIEPVAANASEPNCLEILLRLREEEEQMLPPGGFFPVAEHYGLMGEIDRWVIRNLLGWCAGKIRDDGSWRMPLYCVNLSSAGLCDSGFSRYVQSELASRKIPGNCLCFEIAELDVINHGGNVRALMTLLKPLGCRFTADGFGSVRASFATFKDLTFDFVKIDGVIIQNILREQSDLAKTRAIVLACKKIGVRTIAEFVESQEMLIKLREIGIDYVQGFGVGKPGPLTQF